MKLLRRIFSIPLLIVVVSLSRSAFALFGADPKPGSPGSVCRIRFQDGDTLKGVCTGALIKKSEIITAGHCVSDLIKQTGVQIVADCGYIGSVPSLVKYATTQEGNQIDIGSPAFTETLKGVGFRIPKDFGINSEDIAFIELQSESRLNVMPILSDQKATVLFDKSDSEISLKPGVSCQFSGTGINKYGVGGIPWTVNFEPSKFRLDSNFVRPLATAYLKFSADLSPEQVALLKAGPTDQSPEANGRYVDQSPEITALPAPGDSGGPFFCKAQEESDWTLVGVLQGPAPNFELEPNGNDNSSRALWGFRLTFVLGNVEWISY